MTIRVIMMAAKEGTPTWAMSTCRAAGATEVGRGERDMRSTAGRIGSDGAAGRRGRVCTGHAVHQGDSRDHKLGRRRRVLVGGRVDGHAEPVAHVDVVLALRRQDAQQPTSAANYEEIVVD